MHGHTMQHAPSCMEVCTSAAGSRTTPCSTSKQEPIKHSAQRREGWRQAAAIVITLYRWHWQTRQGARLSQNRGRKGEAGGTINQSCTF